MRKLILILLMGVFYFSSISAQEQSYNDIITSYNEDLHLNNTLNDNSDITTLINTLYAEFIVVGAIYLLIRLQKQRSLRSVDF